MGDKSVETLGGKIRFSSTLDTFSPFPPKQRWFFCFLVWTDHSADTTLWLGGHRFQLQYGWWVPKHRKAYFSKSVLTTTTLSPIVASYKYAQVLWLLGFLLEKVVFVWVLYSPMQWSWLSTNVTVLTSRPSLSYSSIILLLLRRWGKLYQTYMQTKFQIK